MSFDPTFDLIRAELIDAQRKFYSFHSYHEGYAVILQKTDELWSEIKASHYGNNQEKVRKAAIQLAVKTLRFLNDLT